MMHGTILVHDGKLLQAPGQPFKLKVGKPLLKSLLFPQSRLGVFARTATLESNPGRGSAQYALPAERANAFTTPAFDPDRIPFPLGLENRVPGFQPNLSPLDGNFSAFDFTFSLTKITVIARDKSSSSCNYQVNRVIPTYRFNNTYPGMRPLRIRIKRCLKTVFCSQKE